MVTMTRCTQSWGVTGGQVPGVSVTALGFQRTVTTAHQPHTTAAAEPPLHQGKHTKRNTCAIEHTHLQYVPQAAVVVMPLAVTTTDTGTVVYTCGLLAGSGGAMHAIELAME